MTTQPPQPGDPRDLQALVQSLTQENSQLKANLELVKQLADKNSDMYLNILAGLKEHLLKAESPVEETAELKKENAENELEIAEWFKRCSRAEAENTRLTGALERANSFLRSAYSVAERQGQRTYWEGFKNGLDKILLEQHKILYPTPNKPDTNETT